jgi:hypothetical protein
MQRLLSLPKALLVLVLLGGGIALIIMFNPPYTVCDSQLELFKKNQTGFIYIDEKDKASQTPMIDKLSDRCKETNSPGGCYELFLKMKEFLGDLDRVPSECAGQVTGRNEIKNALWNQIKLMMNLAWGTKPPTNLYDKIAWLDPADLALFCRLKATIESLYGKEAMDNFRETMFHDLPGATNIPRGQAWELMLLSTDCRAYL